MTCASAFFAIARMERFQRACAYAAMLRRRDRWAAAICVKSAASARA